MLVHCEDLPNSVIKRAMTLYPYECFESITILRIPARTMIALSRSITKWIAILTLVGLLKQHDEKISFMQNHGAKR